MNRFWSKVNRIPGGCWEWTGTFTARKRQRSYGQFWLDGRIVLAHRYAYETRVGPIPRGLDIDHLCRNPRCVRPSHLEPVTRSENNKRGLQGIPITHCQRGHAFTEANTYTQPKSGRRACHVCKKQRDRDRRAARSCRGA